MAVSQSIPKFATMTPSNSQSIWVAKHGSDVNGTGTLNNPYLTVEKALSVITDASTTKPYTIFIGPGIYDEASLALKGNVYLVGCGNIESLACRIGVTGNLVTGNVATIGGGCRYGIANIYFRGTTGLSIDLTTGGSGGSNLVMNNVAFNGAITYKGRQEGDAFEWFNGLCYSDVTIQGLTSVQLQNSNLIGTTTFNDTAQSPIMATIVGGQYNNVVVSTSQTGNPEPANNFLQIFGASVATATLTQGVGTGVYLLMDAVSYPYNGLTYNSGTLYKATDMRTISWNVTSTATAAGTTTLTAVSNTVQEFTGTTTQTVVLPAANKFSAGTGQLLIIKNNSTGDVTVQRAGSDTIDGATSKVVAGGANNVLRLISDGTSKWFLV